MELTGKVTIITGGSSGIGLAAAKMLEAEGAKIVIAAPSTHLQSAKAQIPSAFMVETDMTDYESVEDMINSIHAHFGRIDILVNNAGRGYEGPLELVDVHKLDYLFKLHVAGPLRAMQCVTPIMRKQGQGKIVNVCTPTAKMPIPGLGAYSTTKAALRYMSLVARKELAKDNITVSLFYPFITASGFGSQVFETKAGKVMQAKAKSMPDPDTVEFTAARLVAALKSSKKEFESRSDAHFLIGLIKKKFKNWESE
jgi:NAD(P)-dependent dehydrogenase (short-subunit alcohol dehydrogenase family)